MLYNIFFIGIFMSNCTSFCKYPIVEMIKVMFLLVLFKICQIFFVY